MSETGLRPRPSSEVAMSLFPESATFGWVIGVGIAAALVGCVIVALIVRSWPRKHG
jgi:hypothetical protein